MTQTIKPRDQRRPEMTIRQRRLHRKLRLLNMPPCTCLLPCQETARSRGLEPTPAPERLMAASAAKRNTPTGGFSTERQWRMQLSTLLFIYDKLKSDLICARRRVLNRVWNNVFICWRKASGAGARGRHPFTEITQDVSLPSKPCIQTTE